MIGLNPRGFTGLTLCTLAAYAGVINRLITVILPDVAKGEEAETVARKIITALAAPFAVV